MDNRAKNQRRVCSADVERRLLLLEEIPCSTFGELEKVVEMSALLTLASGEQLWLTVLEAR